MRTLRITILSLSMVVMICVLIQALRASQVTPEVNRETIKGIANAINATRDIQKAVVANQLIIEGRMSRLEAIMDVNNKLLIAIFIGFLGMIIDRVAQIVKASRS